MPVRPTSRAIWISQRLTCPARSLSSARSRAGVVAEEFRGIAAADFGDVGRDEEPRPGWQVRLVLVHGALGTRVRASHPADADQLDSDGPLRHLLPRR
jgi:hypothetical protein